jgi:hypothetical protein
MSAIAILFIAASASRWAHSLMELAGRPASISLAGALLTFACVVTAARLVVTRRALDHRVALVAVPADSFDPSDEAVLRFASGLNRSRRRLRGLLDAPASAVRLRLDADDAGRLQYGVEVPAHARGALRAAFAAYSGVELQPVPTAAAEAGEAEIARAELVLARPSSEPLRAAGLDPDPLSGFARAFDVLDPAGGDAASVCVDLLPSRPANVAGYGAACFAAPGAGSARARPPATLWLAFSAGAISGAGEPRRPSSSSGGSAARR